MPDAPSDSLRQFQLDPAAIPVGTLVTMVTFSPPKPYGHTVVAELGAFASFDAARSTVTFDGNGHTMAAGRYTRRVRPNQYIADGEQVRAWQLEHPSS